MANFFDKFVKFVMWGNAILAVILASGGHYEHAAYLMTVSIFLKN